MDIYIGVFLKKRRYFCGNSDKPFLSEKNSRKPGNIS